jgi:ABC-type glutathione transport system ATPase component
MAKGSSKKVGISTGHQTEGDALPYEANAHDARLLSEVGPPAQRAASRIKATRLRRKARGMSTLETREISKTYRGRRVVDDVSVFVQQGEVVGLLGPEWRGQDDFVLHDRRLDQP